MRNRPRLPGRNANGGGLKISIGSTTKGSKVVGGGEDEIALSFYVTFPIHTDRFQHVSTRLQATGVGYAAVDSFSDRVSPSRRSISRR